MSLVARNVSKQFGSLKAVQPLDVEFLPGEVHAVVGENGAGKSTLVGLLAGFLSPTTGTIALDGTEIPYGRPFLCQKLGIEMIHQHFTLVPAFTAEENLSLARLPGLVKAVRSSEVAKRALEIGSDLGWEIPLGQPVRTLPVGVQQRLEILKALSGSAKVIIFDEPTAVLTPDEVEDLLRVIRQLKEQGKIVILIAHKLTEVFAVADRVTVLRKGAFIGTSEIGNIDSSTLAEWMVGDVPVAPKRSARTPGDVLLKAENLTVKGDRGETALTDLSFEVRANEIFGVGGVDGNGQIELAEVVAGIRPSNLRISGRIGYIPQDRQTDGLALTMTIVDNMWIEGQRRGDLTSGPLLRLNAGLKWTTQMIKKFSIKARSPRDLVRSLSGGNQQKVVVSRVLDQRPDILVAVNPTRGLDLKAVEFVHEQIRNVSEAGTAVLLISTDLDELVALSDRYSFLSRGRFVDGIGAAGLVGGVQV